MSSILEGADQGYLAEYNASEDERRLEALQHSIGDVRKATKGGKYLGNDVVDIMVQIETFAEQLGIDPDELRYYEDQVREAQSNLESAIYGLEEPFEDAIRSLQGKIDDAISDAEFADDEIIDEVFDNDAFNDIFKSKPDRREPSRPDISGAKRVADRKVAGSSELPKIKTLPGAAQYTSEDGKKSQRLDPSCWNGYKKQGTKMKGDTKVNNCVKKESRIGSTLSMVSEEYERNLREGNGKMRSIAAGALLIASLWGVNNHLAQQAYDSSSQLQQLTALHQKAIDSPGQEAYAKELKQRIANHKIRLDIGKGDIRDKHGAIKQITKES